MLMILTYTTYIGKIFELTLGQGQKAKGQRSRSNLHLCKQLEKMMKNKWINKL